jgi:phage gpG-like protein
MIRARIIIDQRDLTKKAVAESRKRLQAIATDIGDIAASQAKRRFDNAGDEELRWPDLWANDSPRVARSIAGFIGKESVAQLRVQKRVEVASRRKSLERAREKLAKAKTPEADKKARSSVKRARNRLRISREEGTLKNTSYRRGGEPLRDKGSLAASVSSRVTLTDKGATIGVGSPRPYARYHQDGFTTKGPNFIPLTLRAKNKAKGVKPEEVGLVPGVDYIMAWGGVTVPARPFVRFTAQDKAEILETLRIAGRRV